MASLSSRETYASLMRLSHLSARQAPTTSQHTPMVSHHHQQLACRGHNHNNLDPPPSIRDPVLKSGMEILVLNSESDGGQVRVLHARRRRASEAAAAE